MAPATDPAKALRAPNRTDAEREALDETSRDRARHYVGIQRSPLTVTVFAVLTLGLSVPFLLMGICDDLNKALGEDRLSPWWAVISSLCFPIVAAIWLVRIAFALSDAAAMRRVDVLAGANLALLTILFPPFGLYLLQSGLNQLWQEGSKTPAGNSTPGETS